MHIPDGVLTLPVAGASAAVSLAGVGAALRRLRTGVPRRTVPLMGLAAAFILAAQMLNFPVGAGTSGHLVGGTLAAVLLGPAAAVIVMTAVLATQCLLLADGGLLALGANVLDMALVSVLGGYFVYRLLTRAVTGTRGVLMGGAVAAWCSTVLAATACGAVLAWSDLAPASRVVPAMALVHAVIGLGEAAITALVLAAIVQTRPDLIPRLATSGRDRPIHVIVGGGLAACIGLVVFAAPFASTQPDGLERVIHALGATAGGPPGTLGGLPLLYEAGPWSVACYMVAVLMVVAIVLGLARLVQPRGSTGSL